MPTDVPPDELTGTSAEDLTDELAKKYDPELLLKLLSKRAGRGERLEHSIRSRYEKRFGVDLGHVRVYTGEFAEEFNRKRGAYAVTVGATGMILMGNSPEKSLGSASGQALLAHELTHVAQQARGLHRKATFDGAMPFASEHEQEADAVEQAVRSEKAGTRNPAAKDSAVKALKQQLEQIKQRVLELAGDAARNHHVRVGIRR